MNALRRKELASITSRIEELKAQLEELQNDLGSCQYDEQEYLDNIPENLQSSERYERAETSANALDEAVDALNEDMEYFDSCLESIEEAVEA